VWNARRGGVIRGGVIIGGFCAACLANGDSRGTALYPVSERRLPPERVATLSGHVGQVDGRDVSSLTAPFELLPGCHVVLTPSRWGSVGTSGTMTAQTGVLPFALPMLAGHFYTVEVRAQLDTTIAGKMEVRAIEVDASGQQTRVFAVSRDPAELEACRI
jgi:hypothetical protein